MADRVTADIAIAWDQWVVRALGGRPWPASFIIAALAMASYWLSGWLLGVYGTDLTPADHDDLTRTLGLDPFAWAATVTSLLAGYALTVVSYGLVAQRRELPETAAMLGVDPAWLERDWLEALRRGARGGRIWGVSGYVLGAAIILYSTPGARELFGLEGRFDRPPPDFMMPAAIWFLVVTPFLFYLLAKGVHFTIHQARYFGRLRRQYLQPDLFNPDKLKPVSRAALRGSLMWVIGSTIGSLFFLSEEIERSALAPFFAGIVAIAVATLAAPLLGVHRKLVAEKARALKYARAVMARCWDELRAAGNDAQALARMGGLLALEARIENAREWPIDFSTLGRFGLYLAIPLASWIGGALMERVVDAAIG